MSTPTSTRIDFTEEQAMMLETAVDFCSKQSPIAKVRNLIDDVDGYDSAVWREMIDLGWLGIAVPEEYGGSGLGLAGAVTLVEPMGRHLLTTPFVSTTLAAQALIHGGSAVQKARYLKKICDGAAATVALFEQDGNWDLRAIGARATRDGEMLTLSGTKTFVTDAKSADFMVVSANAEEGPALVLVDREALPANALTRETVVDETRRSYRVCLDGIEVSADAVLETAAFDQVRNAALLLQVAEMCGGTAGVLDVLLEYLKTRTQFGRRIGSYQALKHPTVDVLVGLEQSRSHLYHAATVMGTDEEETAVRMAKAAASEAFAFAGDRAVQFHGGFGFTYECDAQLYLRRAMWCQYQFGDAQHQRKHLADLLF